jgi:hypothetical protein
MKSNRRLLPLSAGAALMLALAMSPARAADGPPVETSGAGTISKLDLSDHRFNVRTEVPLAPEQVFYWNEATKLEGDPLREGAYIVFRTVQTDGKALATWIHVGRRPDPPPPPARGVVVRGPMREELITWAQTP